MNYKILLLFLFLFASAVGFSQPHEKRNIRLADTLTPQEKTIPRVLLRSELDSLVQAYNAKNPIVRSTEPLITLRNEIPPVFSVSIIAGLLLVAGLLYLLFRNQKRSTKTIGMLNRYIQQIEFANMPLPNGSKLKTTQNLEKKIGDMHGELEKFQAKTRTLEEATRQLKVMKQDYELLKKQISDAFKTRNYPGYDESKEPIENVKSLLETEKSVAAYAYEKFLKPILAIADTNKNNPAKINKEESERLLQLLVSLSLLYIEYLYLRVNDLSIGGKMVQRIQGFSNGNGLDPALLKELNTEHGSRALVIRMVLDAMNIRKLSYPVFDETNLNLS
jgi:hypothetical protein